MFNPEEHEIEENHSTGSTGGSDEVGSGQAGRKKPESEENSETTTETDLDADPENYPEAESETEPKAEPETEQEAEQESSPESEEVTEENDNESNKGIAIECTKNDTCTYNSTLNCT